MFAVQITWSLPQERKITSHGIPRSVEGSACTILSLDRAKTPLTTSSASADEAGQPAAAADDDDDEQADEIIDEFKDFIDNVSPEDFAG